MYTRIAFAGLAAGAIASGGVVALAGPASAHSPSGGADCVNGVHAEGSNYSGADTNTLTVSVDGGAVSKTFAVTDSIAKAIPQDGLPHSWTWSVHTTNPDPSFSDSDSGTITCGTVPPPPPPPPTPPTPPTHVKKHIKTRTIVNDSCNCFHDSVKMKGNPAKVQITGKRVNKTTWRFVAVGEKITKKNGDTLQYLLPNKIGGSHGWNVRQVYTVHTTSKPCPCRKTHTCHKQPKPKNPCPVGRGGIACS